MCMWCAIMARNVSAVAKCAAPPTLRPASRGRAAAGSPSRPSAAANALEISWTSSSGWFQASRGAMLTAMLTTKFGTLGLLLVCYLPDVSTILTESRRKTSRMGEGVVGCAWVVPAAFEGKNKIIGNISFNPFTDELRLLPWTAPTRSRCTARRAPGSLTWSAISLGALQAQ